jgi:hypothetical protein
MLKTSTGRLLARWMTPRFPLEMAAASVTTLAVVLTLGGLGRATSEPKLVKLSVKPAPIDRPMTDEDEARASFIERFALAHVAPRLPETVVVDPARASASAAQRGPTLVLTHERMRVADAGSVVASPPRRPADLTLPQAASATPARPTDGARKSADEAFRIPLISDAVAGLGAKLPSGRDMLDGVGAVARRVGGLFSGNSRS